MEKCYVCKSNRRQLLMLSCSHDVCIKCAADNYFLNNIGHRQKKKQQKKQKKESYFCEICLQVTKIDQATIGELKQWYMMNVNGKSLSKVGNNINRSKERSKDVGRLGEEKIVTKSKPTVTGKSQYPGHLMSQQQQRYMRQQKHYISPSSIKNQKPLQKQQHLLSNNYQQSNNHQKYYIEIQKQNQYEQRNYHINRTNNNKDNNPHYNNTQKYRSKQMKNNRKQQMPEQYQGRQLLRYKQANEQQYVRNQRQKQSIPQVQYDNDTNHDNYYQRFSYNPYQNHVINNNNNIPLSTNKNDNKSSLSKQKKRVFGSIVKRDSVKNDQGYRQSIIRAKQQQRRRIDSYKSEEKFNSEWNTIGRRIQTQTDVRSMSKKQGSVEGRIGQRRQQRNIQQVSTTPRQTAAQRKKKQVYLDLIGYQHSLQSQNQSYCNGQGEMMTITPNSIDRQHQDYPHYYNQQENENYRHNQSQPKNQRKQIINKFAIPSTYYNTQNTTTPTSVKSPKNNHHNTNIMNNNFKNNNNNLIQQYHSIQKLYCNIHQDEEIIYYCLQCKLLICSQCALYGQHKDHNIHTLKKAAFKLKQTLYVLISQMNSYLLIQEQKQQLLLQQIKQLKVESNKQKEKVKFAFENFIKNVQNKYAQVLEQLQESQAKALLGFNSQLQRTKQKCTQFFDRKTSMKNLFETFAKNPTNNQLVGPFFQYDSIKNLAGGSTNASNSNQPVDKINNNNNNRMYRQFDDFFQQNSMTSQQRNFFNTNIEELQAKISQYEEYVKKLKPEYQKIIYPTLYANCQTPKSKRNDSTLKNIEFFRSRSKSRRQSLQLHESLKLSETSLLIQPSSPKKMPKYEDFLGEQNFIEENNLKSLNLVIEKQLVSSQFSQLKQNLKLANVDTIVDSIKQIEEIIKQFRIEFRVYDIKAGRRG